ncbi:MAG: hypothetical protein LUD00_08400 [Prevotellaceae bacterium]|nr:hypothetical protein [Prevotellaceae bacterium]
MSVDNLFKFQGENIACCIAIGYGETQGISHKVKTVERVSKAANIVPLWFRKGTEAVLLAPTAVNKPAECLF